MSKATISGTHGNYLWNFSKAGLWFAGHKWRKQQSLSSCFVVGAAEWLGRVVTTMAGIAMIQPKLHILWSTKECTSLITHKIKT